MKADLNGQAVVLESGETLIFFWNHLETFNPNTRKMRMVSGAEYVLRADSNESLLLAMGVARKKADT